MMTLYYMSSFKNLLSKASSGPAARQNKAVVGKKKKKRSDNLKDENGKATTAKHMRLMKAHRSCVDVGMWWWTQQFQTVLDCNCCCKKGSWHVAGVGPAPTLLESVCLRAVLNTTVCDLHAVGSRAQSEAWAWLVGNLLVSVSAYSVTPPVECIHTGSCVWMSVSTLHVCLAAGWAPAVSGGIMKSRCCCAGSKAPVTNI